MIRLGGEYVVPLVNLMNEHMLEAALMSGLVLLGSYHVSQQNTFTGKLTPAMFDAVLQRAKELSIE